MIDPKELIKRRRLQSKYSTVTSIYIIEIHMLLRLVEYHMSNQTKQHLL